MSPMLRGPALERDAAVRAVVTDALLVPGPVVLGLRNAELVRRLRARGGALDLVAALAAASGAARVEPDHDPVLVLLQLHVAQPAGTAQVAAHRLEREVEVAVERLLVRPLSDVERAVALLEIRLEHEAVRVLDPR